MPQPLVLWENTLAQIERGEFSAETFKKSIEIYAKQITTELLETKINLADNNTPICPKCRTTNVRFFAKVVKCTDAQCELTIFRTRSEKELTDKQITELLSNGKTALIKGFKSKSGKSFNAELKFDENFQVVFDFGEKGKKK